MVLTQKDLREIFEMRNRIRELSETIKGLKTVVERNGDPAAREGVDLLSREVATLQSGLKDREADIMETLELISDPVAKVAMRLRYIHGMSWKEVSVYINRSERAASDIVYRAMRKCLQK